MHDADHGGIYKPRKPQYSQHYHFVEDHFEELEPRGIGFQRVLWFQNSARTYMKRPWKTWPDTSSALLSTRKE